MNNFKANKYIYTKVFLISILLFSTIPAFAQSNQCPQCTGDQLLDIDIRSRQRDIEQLQTGIEERTWAINTRHQEDNNSSIFASIILAFITSSLVISLISIIKRMPKKISISTLLEEYENIYNQKDTSLLIHEESFSDDGYTRGSSIEKLFNEYDNVFKAGDKA